MTQLIYTVNVSIKNSLQCYQLQSFIDCEPQQSLASRFLI